MENQVTVFDHPLIQHKLTHMRDEKTGLYYHAYDS